MMHLRVHPDFVEAGNRPYTPRTDRRVRDDPHVAWRKIAYAFASPELARGAIATLKSLPLREDAPVEFFLTKANLEMVGSRYALKQLRLAHWAQRVRKILELLPGQLRAYEVTQGGVHQPYFRYVALKGEGACKVLLHELRSISAVLRVSEDCRVWFIMSTQGGGLGFALTATAIKR